MPNSCPRCGAEVVLVGRDARVLNGTCTACSGTFTIVEETESAPDGALDSAGSEGRATTASAATLLNCADCGSSLTLRATSRDRIEAVCAQCRTTLTYGLGTPRELPDHGRRPGSFRSGDEGRRPFSPANARPCRECGGPLRFSTGADGTVSGECVACGNRFTLGPRRDPGPPSRGRWQSRGDESGGRGFSRYRAGGRGGGGERRGAPRYGRGPRTYRPRSRPDGDDEAPEESRRRRRHRDG